MPRFFVLPEQIDARTICIGGEDARHISYSLRMKRGDSIVICDGMGHDYRCEISDMDGETVWSRILEQYPSTGEPPIYLRLFQSVPKSDKLDYIVQKSVELGICEIIPVFSERCIVKPDGRNEAKKTERLRRIATEAAKQCGRGILPVVRMPLSWNEALKEASDGNAFICYENEHSVSMKQYLAGHPNNDGKLSFFIGPEGGYTEEEIRQAEEHQIASVGLGERILRCETASSFVLSCISYEWELS